jgi:uncharacterized protein with HEPN domain
MPHDPAKSLRDILVAAERIVAFTAGKSFDDYLVDPMLRAAVERQFMIVGEAIVRVRDAAPGMLAGIESQKKIIAFRNVLVHGYDIVDHEVVWDALATHLPRLVNDVAALLPPDDE